MHAVDRKRWSRLEGQALRWCVRISEVVQRSGVPATTLRYYEALGLVSSRRSANGYRDYDEAVFEQLGFIASAKALRLELPQIAELLRLSREGTCTQVKQRLHPVLVAELKRVEAALEALALLRGQLVEAVEQVAGCPDSESACRSECALVVLQRPASVI